MKFNGRDGTEAVDYGKQSDSEEGKYWSQQEDNEIIDENYVGVYMTQVEVLEPQLYMATMSESF